MAVGAVTDRAAAEVVSRGEPQAARGIQRLHMTKECDLRLAFADQQQRFVLFPGSALFSHHRSGTAPKAPAMYLAYRLTSGRTPVTSSSRMALLSQSAFFSTKTTWCLSSTFSTSIA